MKRKVQRYARKDDVHLFPSHNLRIINLHLKSQSKNHNLLHFNNIFIVCYFNKLYMEFTFLSSSFCLPSLPCVLSCLHGRCTQWLKSAYSSSARFLFFWSMLFSRLLHKCSHHYSYKQSSSWFWFLLLSRICCCPLKLLNDCNHTRISFLRFLAMKSLVEIAQWKWKLWSYAIWYDFYDFNITVIQQGWDGVRQWCHEEDFE